MALDGYVRHYLPIRGFGTMRDTLRHYRVSDSPSFRLVQNAIDELMTDAPDARAPAPAIAGPTAMTPRMSTSSRSAGPKRRRCRISGQARKPTCSAMSPRVSGRASMRPARGPPRRSRMPEKGRRSRPCWRHLAATMTAHFGAAPARTAAQRLMELDLAVALVENWTRAAELDLAMAGVAMSAAWPPQGGIRTLGERRCPAGQGAQDVRRGRGRQRRHTRHRARHDILAARAVRLRQDDDAAPDRRVRAAERGRGLHPRPARDLDRPLSSRFQHGVPELRAVPASERRRECRLRPAHAPRAARRARRRGQGGAGAREARRARRPLSAAIVGRAAAARRAGPRDRGQAGGAAARRAAGRARQDAARGDAGRVARSAAASRHHRRVRHARPGRGTDPVRPGGGDARRRDRADRRAARDLRPAGERVCRRISGRQQFPRRQRDGARRRDRRRGHGGRARARASRHRRRLAPRCASLCAPRGCG